MPEGLPTDLYISATQRRAAQDSIPIMVLRKGDPNSGSLLLKINLLNGTAKLYGQVRLDEEVVWNALQGYAPIADQEADAYLAREAERDPDVWLLEIEDKQGRLWFPGKILEI
jgi:hypothetical protein